MKCPPHPVRRGFLLLEMILALMVFGIAVTGFTVALHRMATVASLAQSEMRITRILQSALDETLSLPTLEEGTNTATVPGPGGGIDIATTVEILDKLENQDGQILQQMYRIEVKARWFENSQSQERIVETWRYGPMYQP